MRWSWKGYERREKLPMRCFCTLLACLLAASVARGDFSRTGVTVAPAPDRQAPYLERDAPYAHAESPESAAPEDAESAPQEEPSAGHEGEEGDDVIETTLGGGEAVGGFFVRDSTDAGLDLDEELQADPNISVPTDGTPTVLIYHTHTTECYLPADTGVVYPSDPSRTLDETQNVVAVGEAIAREMTARGIGVVHDKTLHDSPVYNGAYDRSWETIRKNLEQYPTISMTIDVHRDAMIEEDGTCYKPTATVNGRKAAQVMIITGRDPDGSYGFPEWRQNLHMALKVQEQATLKYGELMRPLNFCDRRYNMDATVNSLLVEFGTHVNTVDEAVYAGSLFGDALADVLLRYAA